ncbi:hypothetical protein PSQ19_01795 [Devosia algicola]|uniref:Uncharacterized protein n=1 Tax=Devosia algicola TaxID=3026418 RepID=A0ABY7YNT6_9HYPH|nr:hypothetical protein [Devosia algicola]WDR02976.1 hypothetical protein PSQ19_01795 [Devosia algicola]
MSFIIDLQSQSFDTGLSGGLSKRDHTYINVVQCVAVALRPTNDPMHGFARPTLRMQNAYAITQRWFWGFPTLVANPLLQIQHINGNELLTGVNERLKIQGFRGFIELKRNALIFVWVGDWSIPGRPDLRRCKGMVIN